MKKTIFYLFVTLLFGSLVLVSCEPKPDDDTNKEQTEQTEQPKDDSIVLPEGTVYLQALNSQYVTGVDMGYSEAVTHSFLLMFATEECEVVQGSPFGSGDVLALELCSATAENILPAEGIYKIGDEIKDGAIVAGFEFSEVPIGTYLRHMVDDEFVGTDYIVAGGVEIKKTDKPNELEFIIYVVFEDGTEGYYYYKGELLIDNLSSAE